MQCPVCHGAGGWNTDSLIKGCPPHHDRCVKCDGTGVVPYKCVNYLVQASNVPDDFTLERAYGAPD